MDYTTRERVLLEMRGKAFASGSTPSDGLLDILVTAASRAFDRKCTGVVDAVDYFKLEAVTGERLVGQIDFQAQSILVYPHKPIIVSCESFTFQQNITTTLFTVPVSRVECYGPQIIAYPQTVGVDFPSRLRVVVNYTGGLSGSQATLPEDLQEMVTILAARFYREAETGLNDAMGVAELAQLVYTRAWPIRVVEQMTPYMRRVGWRHSA